MPHYLKLMKGAQSVRPGEEQMDKLTRLYALYLRTKRANNFSAALREAIDAQYELELPNMKRNEKKLTYKEYKDGTTTGN